MEVIDGKLQTAEKVVLYGPEGIGKSSLAMMFPRPIFIDTEGSTSKLDVKRLKKPSSWEMLRQQVEWVKNQGVSRFGSLIIDTIDWAEMLCVEQICSSHGKKGVEDFGFGKGYIFIAEELGRFLNLLSDVVEAGIHVVLTAHAQIIKFEQPDEMGAYDRYQLKLGPRTGSKTAALVKEWADMVLFINYKTFSIATDDKGKKHKAQGGTRTVYATHHPAWDAKNRHGLPDEFPLDFTYLAHIFGAAPAAQQAPAANPAPLQTAPPTSALPASPPAATQQQPAAAQAPDHVGIVPQLDPRIPQSLSDLMAEHRVAEDEIRLVVSNKGYYPADTPIVNYDPGFVAGVLVGAWPQVLGLIQDIRKNLPF